MKARIESLMGGAALSCVLLASCGGDTNNMAPNPKPPPTPPPVATTTDLTTADVLAIVQTQTSETAAPLQVDNGAVAVVPAGDETGSPISVDGS